MASGCLPDEMASMTARYMVADVFDGLATLETGSVDLVVTSPPFLALRSYLPADHPDKGKEIGSEATPAEFIDVMLRVTTELRRVLAPHGSICVELGDTYAGTNPKGVLGAEEWSGVDVSHPGRGNKTTGGQGWPMDKSVCMTPELYRVALAYGINPLTGQESPAGRWRVRNVVTWVRPNPPVGALGDKWRPATSDLVVACTSGKRYWDDLATRRPFSEATLAQNGRKPRDLWREGRKENDEPLTKAEFAMTQSGAPLLDWWEIPPGGYKGSHYAVFPEELVIPCVQAMCPPKVCRTCGEPSRRIVETTNSRPHVGEWYDTSQRRANYDETNRWKQETGDTSSRFNTLGWSDCGHDDWRPGLILDPFAGSGTTLAVATGYGHDAIGIDLDPRNAELALDRVGPFLLEVAL